MSLAHIEGDIDVADWNLNVPRSIWRQVVLGVMLCAAAFGGFGVWAATAPLAAAIMAPGSFIATGRNKMVQHFEGGIITEVAVAEGDVVTRGQTLLRLDETTALSNRRALTLRRVRLQTIEARLLAEYNALPDLVFSQELEDLRSDPEMADMMDAQLLSFEVARARLENDLDLLDRSIAVLDRRTEGSESERTGVQRQLDLLREDRAGRASLLERGLVTRLEVNAIDRAIAEAEAQLGRLEAEIAESAEMAGRYVSQKTQTLDEYRQAALDELQSVQIELDTVREREREAAAILDRVSVTAPESGTVVRLNYGHVGGVVEPGEVIAEILPSDVPLIVEAMIARTDVDAVSMGQEASIRLVALNQRTTPVLMGRVEYVSADAIMDDSGNSSREVYVVRIGLAPEEIGRVRGFSPVPGMPAEVMIQTEERTFFQYIMKPISDSMQRAFREN